jgi:hypothetical protein
MWPFGKKPETPKPSGEPTLSDPRYAKDPMALFFEGYVLSVLGCLQPEKDKAFQAMNIGRVLKTSATDWRGAVRESLHLSDTIDVAILDLWYRNTEISEKQGALYDPQHFAQDFVDQYNVEGSRVDIWPEGALDAAKLRVEAARQRKAHA